MSLVPRLRPLAFLVPLLACGGGSRSPDPRLLFDPAAPSAPEVRGPEQVRAGVPTDYQLHAIDPQGLPIHYRTRTPGAVIQGDQLSLVVPDPGTVDLVVWAENPRSARSAETTRRITATGSAAFR